MIPTHTRPGGFESDFLIDLGEMRSTIGLHVAAIAVMYGLDVEGGLADVLPELDNPMDD